MHDPMVVVFDVALPVPRRVRWRDARKGQPRWMLQRTRRTNAENFGEPVYAWCRPCGYELRAAGKAFGWTDLATVWHVEPDGRDHGAVCKGMRGSSASWHNVKWAWTHRAHLEVHYGFARKVKRWRHDRCGGCDRRFFWKDTRIGYMSGDAVYHDACMTLRTVRSQLDDATAVLKFDADDTTRWRVEQRLKYLDEKSPA